MRLPLLLVAVASAATPNWELEAELNAEVPAEKRDALKHAVRAEVKRSLTRYPHVIAGAADAKAFVRRLGRAERREDLVVVVDGRVLVSPAFAKIDKNNRHLQFVWSVTQMSNVPNVAYLLDRFAFGDRHPYPSSSANASSGCVAAPGPAPDPEFVIAKYHGHGMCGVLIPNMYVFNEVGKWAKEAEKLKQAAVAKPWKDRSSRVFWRGQILAQDKCHRDGGNHARWSALALAREKPDAFACACLDGKPCAARDAARFPCDGLPYTATMAALVAEDRAKHSKAALPMADFANYKFLLNLPGTISGSYSRHLNVLWALGAVVLLWDSPHVEWYYPALKDGATHVVVDAASAAETAAALLADPNRARGLALRARVVHDLFLCPDCLASHFKFVVDAYRKRFRLEKALDGAALPAVVGDLLREGPLVEVQFGASETRGADAKPTSSIPHLFSRPVRAAPGDAAGFVADGAWTRSPWRPGVTLP